MHAPGWLAKKTTVMSGDWGLVVYLVASLNHWLTVHKHITEASARAPSAMHDLAAQ